MTWNLNGSVTVGAVNYTAESLANVSIQYGRTTVWEQPRAGYATVQILNPDGADNAFDIGDAMVITLDDASGDPVTVFTGKVTSISNSINASGAQGQVIIQTLTGISSFADMARVVVGTTAYPKEFDDDRLSRIFTETGVTVDVVDPGIYEFTARAASASDGYSLAAYYAQMAFGYIYETTDGKVGFANESHRLNEVQASGYFNIPLDYILWQGIQSDRTLSDITNSIYLTYKNNQSIFDDDPTSVTIYGTRQGSIATELENTADATYQAGRYILLRSYPQTNLSSFNVQLNSSFLSSVDLDLFLNMYIGKPIEILNLPIPILHVSYRGFVEGWTLEFTQNEAKMNLRTTDSTYSIVPTRWQDVDPALQWNQVPPTLAWYQYE
jgi:hypothetical protein